VGREVNPTGAQLGKSDRLIAGPASVIDWIVALQRAAAPAAPLVVLAADRALTQAFG
jgi:hypothetical protein